MILWIAALVWNAGAYVPEYATIAARAAEQHGKGAYLVEQEVTFKREAESYTVKETWTSQGENELRLTLEGRGPLRGLVSGTVVYAGGSKYFVEVGQGTRSQRLGEDWLEPLFYFRSAKWFRSRLVGLKVAPPDSLQDRGPMNSEGAPQYETPDFIRLNRVGGTVTWAIGLPPSVGAAPSLWLEQDQFVLRKYRGTNQVLLKADDYAKYQDEFWFPRSRSYQFGPITVVAQTLAVRHLGKLSPGDPRFKAASLISARDGLKLPEIEGFRQFYLRFR